MISKQAFGHTGQNSSRVIFGAAALGQVSQDEADRTLEVLLQYGVNHIDTASSYGDSELRIGPWMKQYRSQFFLATKTKERTYRQSKEEFHRSLERLQVEQVDLLQLHSLSDPIEWQTALGPGGALEMAIEAREQGLTRFIGVTGHGLSIAAMHLRSLANFDFDAVLLPYNYITFQNPKYAADFSELIKLCQAKNVAVQTIKAIARRPWELHGSRPNSTWYEPLIEQNEIDLAVSWVLRQPGIFLNTVGDIHLLPKVLEAAQRYEAGGPGDEAALAAELARLSLVPLFV